ncbi:MAG: hypothetical protein ABJA02_12535 [Acidobacteriota bacterium]
MTPKSTFAGWHILTSVSLNYVYFRNGSYFYTREFGMDLLFDAFNDGYQEKFLAGQLDRDDNSRRGYQVEFAY